MAPVVAPESWRVDVRWVAAVTGVAAGLFLTAFSPAVALGDAPESVSGIHSLGILHAPGYPAYVLLGRLWATVVPVGSWAFRVNVFSVVCSLTTTGLIFVLARSFGAARVPAAVGALTVATSVSFWFNAGFAKHYALSALLVVLAAVSVVAWERRGSPLQLVVAGASLGLGSGASWELIAIMALGLAALVGFGDRRASKRDLGALLGGAAPVAMVVWAFVVVRAGQDPAVNWGKATSVGRLIDLVRQKDFLTGASAPNGVRALPEAPHRLVSYGIITAREVGVVAVAVALVGMVVVFRRHRRGETLFLAVVAVANIVGAVFVAGLEHSRGIAAGMVVGGFLIDLVIVVGVLVAIGATWLSETALQWARHRGARSTTARAAAAIRATVIGTVAVAILLPSVLVHQRYASHRGAALADNYGRRVLSSLPNNAVLVVWGSEFAQPMLYRQVVYGERRDVSIFSGAESPFAWYREQLRHDFPSIAPASGLPNDEYVLAFLNAAVSQRPVYVDMSAISQFTGGVAFRLDGLIARLTGGQGLGAARPLADLARDLRNAQRDDGMLSGAGRRFPNQSISLFELRANLFLASLFLANKDPQGATAELRDAILIRPDISQTRAALRLVEAGDPKAQSLILAVATAH